VTTARFSPCRKEIVAFLAVNGETSLTDLTNALGRAKNNVCHDLKFLREEGLVARRYEGMRAFYSAVTS
jgi:ArsR family transcriptional regulator